MRLHKRSSKPSSWQARNAIRQIEIMISIPFNRPYIAGNEEAYIHEAIKSGRLSAKGPFTTQCEHLIKQYTGASCAMLTNSCTAALEMAVILARLGPDDEVIMPSFTFPSTANACLIRGARPVFVDIRRDTLNIDETRIEAAITERTRAIMVVHYAGVACEMDAIMAIAKRHGLIVIEDAAHAFLARYRGRALGTIGHMATFSFHATKNISCGEGGALLINDERFLQEAEILGDKGTNRAAFQAGKVKKYSWVGLGTSASMGELSAAYLLAQLEAAATITRRRIDAWHDYNALLGALNVAGRIVTPGVPDGITHNGHIYYLLASSSAERDHIQAVLREQGIESASHYEPLHDSLAGRAHCVTHGNLDNTEAVSGRILRLPLWPDIGKDNVSRVAKKIVEAVVPDQQ